MKNLKFIGIICSLYFFGCTPLYYIPTTQNVPLITEQGETNLTVASNYELIELQGAVGLTDKIGIQLNGALYYPAYDGEGDGGNGNLIELGGGYYKPLKYNLVFETYGLLGMGKVENHLPSTVEYYPQTKGDISAKFFRYGIQPNFGYKRKNYAAALSSKFFVQHYSDIKGDLIFNDVAQVDLVKANRTNYLIEPAITLKGGSARLQLQFQYGLTLNLSHQAIIKDDAFFSFGINYGFNYKQKMTTLDLLE